MDEVGVYENTRLADIRVVLFPWLEHPVPGFPSDH
jgi:hypothetical protein